MAREVKVGDIVKLKCCPQEMVVERSVEDYVKYHLSCVWIDDCGDPHREQYPYDILNFVAEGSAEAKFKGKPAPEEEPVTIKDSEIPF